MIIYGTEQRAIHPFAPPSPIERSDNDEVKSIRQLFLILFFPFDPVPASRSCLVFARQRFDHDAFIAFLQHLFEEGAQILHIISLQTFGKPDMLSFLRHFFKGLHAFFIGLMEIRFSIEKEHIKQLCLDGNFFHVFRNIVFPAPLHEGLKRQRVPFLINRKNLPFDHIFLSGELLIQIRNQVRELLGDILHASGEENNFPILFPMCLHPFTVVLAFDGHFSGHLLRQLVQRFNALREHHLNRPAHRDAHFFNS